MDERYFPNAEAFEPQRWLATATPGAAANSAKRVSMPFGAGPRVCPGRYLALLEIKMAVAMLLAHFDIESVGHADGSEAAELHVVHDDAGRPADAPARTRLSVSSFSAQRGQRLLGIGDQVVHRFEPERKAHQRAARRPTPAAASLRS